jgi:hypothetical protein
MTPLRHRMIEGMQIRNLAKNTQRSYLLTLQENLWVENSTAMAAAKTAGESDGKAGTEIGGSSALQLPDCQELPAEGRVSTVLVVQVALLGRPVPRQVAHKDNAIEDRADEENVPPTEATSTTAAELVPSQRPILQRYC